MGEVKVTRLGWGWDGFIKILGKQIVLSIKDSQVASVLRNVIDGVNNRIASFRRRGDTL